MRFKSREKANEHVISVYQEGENEVVVAFYLRSNFSAAKLYSFL